MEKTSLLSSDFSSVAHPNVFQLYKLIRFFHITLYIYHHNLCRKTTKIPEFLAIFGMYVRYV